MPWRATMAVLVAAAVPVFWLHHAGSEYRPPCTGPFDATFLQIRVEQRSFDVARWKGELAVLRDVGVRLVILQYSGDEHGSYDRGAQAPVAALLRAAESMGIEVMLGLHEDPDWPGDAAMERLAPPLDKISAARELGELCVRSAACTGWYISQEIDDTTWSDPEQTAALRRHLARTSSALHELAPGKSVAIAPFFTRALAPDEYARWWLDVLEPGAIDILILQDGVGTGRATAEVAASYLEALRPVLDDTGVELWAVAELFDQTHGPPLDRQRFEAIPMQPAKLRHSLAIESQLVERVVAFAVLDYMDPRRGGDARRLHDDYVARCRAGRTSC